MSRPRKSRIWWREGRAWADFRDYVDVGGKREPLVPAGHKMATTNADLAAELAAQRLLALRLLRQQQESGVTPSPAPALAPFARDHLIAKKKAGSCTDGWLAAQEGFFRRAVEHFGATKRLDTIRPSDVRAWMDLLSTTHAIGRKRPMQPGTVRAHLFALSNLYRRAQESELVPLGYNPVAALMDKPSAARTEARWLEVPDAALLLESARTLPDVVTAAGTAIDARTAYPLVAAFLYTGGRRSEVLGLELDDVSLDRRTVTFRPNKWRRLKTRGSFRVVALWPELERILRAYLFGARLERGGKLLFPGGMGGQESMLSETRRLLDRIGKRVGWKAGEIRHRIFRHSYTAARLQTLDHGAPVSIYTVSRELGHGSEDMVRRVYAHLGDVRHRSEVVEFRVEQHFKRLGDQLRRLGFVTSFVTNPEPTPETETPRAPVTDGGDVGSDSWARRDSNARPLAPEDGPSREPV